MCYLFSGCVNQTEERVTQKISETDSIPSNDIVKKYSEFAQWERWNEYQAQEIDSILFFELYENKKKMHFKGPMDFDTTYKDTNQWGDTIGESHYELAHDIYISNFSKKGFEFIIDSWETPIRSCYFKGKAKFDKYNTAVYEDTCLKAEFHFYHDTLVFETEGGCHYLYCGATAEFGRVFILQKNKKK